MKNMDVLREQWMWNREARSIWLWVFIASGVILAAVLYQFQGAMGLGAGFLPLLFACAIVGPMYGYVDRNVRALRESLEGEEGDMAEGLAAIGSIQGPAIVIMKETELVLVPLVGKHRPLSVHKSGGRPLEALRSPPGGPNTGGNRASQLVW